MDETISTTAPQDHSSQLRAALETWYARARTGTRLRDQVRRELEACLDELFGYHLLVLGPDIGLEIDALTRIRNRMAVTPGTDGTAQLETRLVALDEELPIETDSVDVVVLLHSLDTSEDPHQVLREARRVLTPHGHLVLLGFNPVGVLGLLRRLPGLRRPLRWQALQPVSAHKVQDWLSLLDFRCAPVRHKLVLPTLGRGRLARFFAWADEWLVRHNLPMGSAYLIRADKLVRGHIQPATEHRRAPRLIPIPVGKPVAGASQAPRQRRQQPPPRLRPVE